MKWVELGQSADGLGWIGSQNWTYGKKGSPYSITERRVPELIPVLGSQPAGDVSHKPGGRLSLLSATPAVTPATVKGAATNFCCLVNNGTMGVNSLPKTVTRQRRDCDLNQGPSAPESSALTTRLPSLWTTLVSSCRTQYRTDHEVELLPARRYANAVNM